MIHSLDNIRFTRGFFVSRTSLLILFLILGSFVVSAQKTFSISGFVQDSVTGKPIEMVLVSIPDLNYWTNSGNKGDFSFQHLPAGEYTLFFHILGYQETSVSLSVKAGLLNQTIRLQPKNLSLKEIQVTAKEKTFGTSSVIGSDAIRHIQPKSLTDVFQLQPGQITENPNLKSPGQARIREIKDDNNSALGTLVLIDGSPVSNDENMQAFSTAKSGNVTSANGTLGRGTDLREVSAENIESVEIIRGIPSAEYGNLTSGVVLVKTKSGESPWKVGLKTDPNTKIASIGKGFRLPGEAGVMNAGLDYTQAYDDMRLRYEGYTRITGSLGYSNTFLKNTTPLSLNTNFSFFHTMDEEKTDPQLKIGEIIRSGNKGLRGGVNGKWLLRKKWMTNLEYNVSGDYAVNEDYIKRNLVLSSGAVPNSTSRISQEYATNYLPGTYYSTYTMDGRPYSLNGKIKGEWVGRQGEVSTKVLAGMEASLKGNNGDGLDYDESTPPTNVVNSGVRPRAYKDLPKLKMYSSFLEAKATIPISSTALILQTGVRSTLLNPGKFTSLEPRFVLNYELLNRKNNALFEVLEVSAGYGLAAKMPTLSYLNPDKAYFDEVSFNYLDGDQSLAVVTTNVVENTSNPDLKPAHNGKMELGLHFRIHGVSANITAYHEKMKDGFAYTSQPNIFSLRKYSVSGSGMNPTYENGQVYYTQNGVKQADSYSMDTVIRTYNMPTNSEVLIKKGLEYTISGLKLDFLRTSFVLDGAYIYVESYNTEPTYQRIYSLYQGAAYPYIAIMPGNEKNIKQRFNTNIRTITHIPEIRMVVSLTMQIIWTERTQYRWEDENGVPYVYYYNESGDRVEGSTSAYNDMSATRYVDPIAFMDKNGTVHPWDKSYSLDSRYSAMVSTNSSSYYYVEENLPPFVLMNLRLTKEFAENFEVSFMANNFLKANPYQKSNRTSGYVQRVNDDSRNSFYFGAELSFKF
jgi:hypothetical protein